MILLNDVIPLALLCEKIEEIIVKDGREKTLDPKESSLGENFINRYKPFIVNSNLRKLCIASPEHAYKYIKLTNAEKIVKKHSFLKYAPVFRKILKQKNEIKKVCVDFVTKYNVILKLSTPSDMFEIKLFEDMEGEIFEQIGF